MSIWYNSGNYRRLQLSSDPLLRSKALSEQGTPLALHWFLSAHMETNKAPTSSDLPASCFPLHSPATTPGHKQNALEHLLTLQLPFYCPASSCRWVACQETQGSSDRSGTLRRRLWKPQRKREEGNTYVPFTLLSRRGCWKLDFAHDSWLMLLMLLLAPAL